MDTGLLTSSPTWWVVVVAACLLVLGGGTAALRARARSRRALEELLARTDELRREVDALRAAAAPGATGGGRRVRPEQLTPFVITDAGAHDVAATGPGGDPADPGDAPVDTSARLDGRLFTDLVLRESAVRATTLVHGLRRALAPETRHRIRSEMRLEVKRARRQRRSQVREARRRVAAEQRSTLSGEPGWVDETAREGAA